VFLYDSSFLPEHACIILTLQLSPLVFRCCCFSEQITVDNREVKGGVKVHDNISSYVCALKTATLIYKCNFLSVIYTLYVTPMNRLIMMINTYMCLMFWTYTYFYAYNFWYHSYTLTFAFCSTCIETSLFISTFNASASFKWPAHAFSSSLS